MNGWIRKSSAVVGHFMWDAWEWTKNLLLLLLPFKSLLCSLTNSASRWLVGNAGKWQPLSPSSSASAGPRSLSNIPGPRPSLPYFGTTWTYWFGEYPLSKLHKANEHKLRVYGKIMKEEFGFNCPLVQIFDPKDMELVLKHQGRCPIRPANAPMAKFRSEHPEKYNSVGLVNVQGEEWYQLRAKLSPILLRQKTVVQYLGPMNDILEDFASLVRTVRDSRNQVGDAISILYRLALEGVLFVCLETRFGCLDPELKEDSEAHEMIRSAYNLFAAYQQLYFGPPLWRYFKTDAYNQMAHAETVAYRIASKYVEQAMEQARELQASGCLDEKERGLTILSELIARDDMDPKDVRTAVVDFIVAGIDTVATTVLFILYQLASNPEAQEKLRQEVDVAAPFGAPVNARAIANMPYLKACVKETFRLSPTIPNTVRVLPEDIVIQNYHVPAGTPICCHTMVASQQEEFFPEPERFRPERWTERDTTPAPHPFAVLPFGFGSRACIGQRLAEQEIYVTVAKIVQHFRLECDEPNMECVYRFMIVPEKPLALRFIDRY